MSKYDICNRFMNKWKDGDYKGLKDLVQKTWGSKQDDIAESLKDMLNKIEDFEIISIKYNAEANEILGKKIFADAMVKIDNRKVKIRLVREKGAYKPSEEGDWGVNPISILRNA